MKPSTKKSLSLWACLLLVFFRGLLLDSIPDDSLLSWPVEFVFAGTYIILCMHWFLVDASLHGTTFKDSRLSPRLYFARSSMLRFPSYFQRTRGKAAWKPILVAIAFLPLSFLVMFLGAVIVPLSKIAWYWFNR